MLRLRQTELSFLIISAVMLVLSSKISVSYGNSSRTVIKVSEDSSKQVSREPITVVVNSDANQRVANSSNGSRKSDNNSASRVLLELPRNHKLDNTSFSLEWTLVKNETAKANLSESESHRHEDWVTFDGSTLLENDTKDQPDRAAPSGNKNSADQDERVLFDQLNTRTREDERPKVRESVTQTMTIDDGKMKTRMVSKSGTLSPALRKRIIEQFVKKGGNPENIVVSDSTVSVVSHSKKKTVTTVYKLVTPRPKFKDPPKSSRGWHGGQTKLDNAKNSSKGSLPPFGSHGEGFMPDDIDQTFGGPNIYKNFAGPEDFSSLISQDFDPESVEPNRGKSINVGDVKVEKGSKRQSRSRENKSKNSDTDPRSEFNADLDDIGRIQAGVDLNKSKQPNNDRKDRKMKQPKTPKSEKNLKTAVASPRRSNEQRSQVQIEEPHNKKTPTISTIRNTRKSSDDAKQRSVAAITTTTAADRKSPQAINIDSISPISMAGAGAYLDRLADDPRRKSLSQDPKRRLAQRVKKKPDSLKQLMDSIASRDETEDRSEGLDSTKKSSFKSDSQSLADKSESVKFKSRNIATGEEGNKSNGDISSELKARQVNSILESKETEDEKDKKPANSTSVSSQPIEGSTATKTHNIMMLIDFDSQSRSQEVPSEPANLNGNSLEVSKTLREDQWRPMDSSALRQSDEEKSKSVGMAQGSPMVNVRIYNHHHLDPSRASFTGLSDADRDHSGVFDSDQSNAKLANLGLFEGANLMEDYQGHQITQFGVQDEPALRFAGETFDKANQLGSAMLNPLNPEMNQLELSGATLMEPERNKDQVQTSTGRQRSKLLEVALPSLGEMLFPSSSSISSRIHQRQAHKAARNQPGVDSSQFSGESPFTGELVRQVINDLISPASRAVLLDSSYGSALRRMVGDSSKS